MDLNIVRIYFFRIGMINTNFTLFFFFFLFRGGGGPFNFKEADSRYTAQILKVSESYLQDSK